MNDNANDDNENAGCRAWPAWENVPRLATWEERMAALSSAAPKPPQAKPDLPDTIAAAAAGPILACLKETEGDPKARDDQSVAEEVAYDITAGIIDSFDLDMVEELLVELIRKGSTFDHERIAGVFDRLKPDMRL